MLLFFHIYASLFKYFLVNGRHSFILVLLGSLKFANMFLVFQLLFFQRLQSVGIGINCVSFINCINCICCISCVSVAVIVGGL